MEKKEQIQQKGTFSLLVTCSFKYPEDDWVNRIYEESDLKSKIAHILEEGGYKYMIAPDELIKDICKKDSHNKA